jgi:hypothetical protein
VQVDPIKPMLKAAGITLLELKYDTALSNFAFEFNLRRYSVGAAPAHVRLQDAEYLRHLAAAHLAQSVAPSASASAPPGAGLVRTYIELLTKVRRCRLTPA